MAKIVPKPAKKSGKPDKVEELIVAQNRAASYNYHILDKFEAGLVLHGTEVKALREGKANIRDAYVEFKASGAWLANAHIAQYFPAVRGITNRSAPVSFCSTRGKLTSSQVARKLKV